MTHCDYRIGLGLVMAVAAMTANAAITPIATGPIGSTYSQSFDTILISSRTAEKSTLDSYGWSYNTSGEYVADDGSSSDGNIYSYGNSSDRAFGTLRPGVAAIGVAFENTSGKTITTLDVSYQGEQWRRSSSDDALEFEYIVGSGSVSYSPHSAWTSVSALDFASLQTGAAGALDGNAAGNHVLISGTLSGLNISPGEKFTLRWYDSNVSNEAGLAIDDFSMTTVPEPATCIAGVLLLLPFGMSTIRMLPKRHAA